MNVTTACISYNYTLLPKPRLSWELQSMATVNQHILNIIKAAAYQLTPVCLCSIESTVDRDLCVSDSSSRIAHSSLPMLRALPGETTASIYICSAYTISNACKIPSIEGVLRGRQAAKLMRGRAEGSCIFCILGMTLTVICTALHVWYILYSVATDTVCEFSWVKMCKRTERTTAAYIVSAALPSHSICYSLVSHCSAVSVLLVISGWPQQLGQVLLWGFQCSSQLLLWQLNPFAPLS